MTMDLRPFDHRDIGQLLALMRSNAAYYQHMNEVLDEAAELRLLNAVPPGAKPGQKSCLGHWDGDRLTGFVEIIKDHPDPGMAVLGLLMVDQQRHRRGLGGLILTEVIGRLRAEGFTAIILSYAKGNLAAEAFWIKHQFLPTGDVDRYDDIELVAMERRL